MNLKISYRWLFIIAGISFFNLQTIELAKRAERLGDVKPESLGVRITSADDVVTAIARDLDRKNDLLAQVMRKNFRKFRDSIWEAQEALKSADPASPLITSESYKALYKLYEVLEEVQIELAQLEQTKSAIENLALSNPEAAKTLADQYGNLAQEIGDNKALLEREQTTIAKLNESIAEKGQQEALQKIAQAQADINLLTGQQVRRVRMQQYANLQGVLDLFTVVTRDIPDATAALTDLKAMEEKLHFLDAKIESVETSLMIKNNVPAIASATYNRDMALAQYDNLKRQYETLKELYTQRMKKKYGSVLGKMILGSVEFSS